MSFKVEHDYNRYKIKLWGIRKSYYAKDVEEIVEAVRHYYGKPHNSTLCPLCKEDT